MNKKSEKYPGLYKFFSIILTPLYRNFYHPNISGLENIPEEGAVVIAGNHINIYDQCNVMMDIKRPVYYMAKKEYFDKKSIAWFFKSCGCIPVDREGDTSKAKESALKVLKEGHALGIFPEGTRNGLKEERVRKLFDTYYDAEKDDYFSLSNMLDDQRPKLSQIYFLEELIKKEVITVDEFKEYLNDVDGSLNMLLKKHVISNEEYYDSLLLPFKYGAVSMARKMKAPVVPFAVTGDYRYHSNSLFVKVGKPIDVSEMTNEEANEALRSAILDLYIKNLRDIKKVNKGYHGE